ncbi:MAG: hypothetical protein ACFBSC_03385 [Microcoleaceae cyanobacterium]
MYAVKPSPSLETSRKGGLRSLPRQPYPARQASKKPAVAQSKARSVSSHPGHPRKKQRVRDTALEMSIRLVANGVLSLCALSALLHILPQQRLARERFSQISAEVELTQERVETQESSFTRHFDPHQSRKIMQEHSNQVDPSRRPVIWLEEELTGMESKPHETYYMGR